MFGIRDKLEKNKTQLFRITTTGLEVELPNAVPSGQSKLGKWQLIDPLPIPGRRFIPGRFQVNPVLLRKYSASCTRSDFIIPVIKNWGEGYRWVGDWASAHVSQQAGISGVISGWTDSSAANRLKIKAYAGMVKPESDLGLLFAEAGETLMMLSNPLKGTRNLLNLLFNKASRRRSRNLSSIAKYLTDQWLEYRYGIMPAIQDASMLMKLFDRKISHFESSLLRSSAREEVGNSTKITNFTFYPTAYLTGKAVSKTETKGSVTATAYYRSDIANRSYGATIYDVIPMAWELVPFSFVVDWVVDVGSWLRATLPNPETSPLGVSISHVQDILTTSYIETVKHNWYSKIYNVPYRPYIEHQRTLVRELHTSMPMLPSVSPQIMNLNRSLDALSLTWRPLENRFRKIRGL